MRERERKGKKEKHEEQQKDKWWMKGSLNSQQRFSYFCSTTHAKGRILLQESPKMNYERESNRLAVGLLLRNVSILLIHIEIQDIANCFKSICSPPFYSWTYIPSNCKHPWRTHPRQMCAQSQLHVLKSVQFIPQHIFNPGSDNKKKEQKYERAKKIRTKLINCSM